jgi:hypothetical protein
VDVNRFKIELSRRGNGQISAGCAAQDTTVGGMNRVSRRIIYNHPFYERDM